LAGTDQKRSGLALFEIDASHSPNVTAQEALMGLLGRIAA